MWIKLLQMIIGIKDYLKINSNHLNIQIKICTWNVQTFLKKYFEIRDKKKGEKVMKRKVKRQLENRESN